MAKKSVWIDNTTPPTNYIWVKTDDAGEVIGVFQYYSGSWVKIATGSNSMLSGDGTIKVTTLEGEEAELYYSAHATNNTVAVRTDTGTLKAKTPINPEDLNDNTTVVTVELLKWQ